MQYNKTSRFHLRSLCTKGPCCGRRTT